MKTYLLRMTDADHKKIKQMALDKDCSMRDMFLSCIISDDKKQIAEWGTTQVPQESTNSFSNATS